jgi:endonuclease-8
MEGPSIVILCKEVAVFKGQTVYAAVGNSKIDKGLLLHQRIKHFKSWGKHFLIVFPKFFLRVHFLMFGSYRVNQRKDQPPRLSLQFEDSSELNFYSCAIKLEEGNVNDHYDWSVDVMSPEWNPKGARKKLKEHPAMNVGDALLDQTIFAGVGNIIKNEVLYRIGVHPESTIGDLPPRKLGDLIQEAHNYSFDFLRWKKKFELKKHWLIYTKKKCPKGHSVKRKHTGRTNRRSFFCDQCQKLYL